MKPKATVCLLQISFVLFLTSRLFYKPTSSLLRKCKKRNRKHIYSRREERLKEDEFSAVLERPPKSIT